MPENSPRMHYALTAIACLILAGNAALYLHLSSKLSGMEVAVSEIKQAQAATRRSALDDGSQPGARNHWTSPGGSASAQGIAVQEDAAQKLMQAKAKFNPAAEASAMDRLMAQEPSIPGVEEKQVRLLESAMQNMPANAPQPAGLQTSCHGRRCMISAGFADESQAEDWASRYLLVGGRNLPKAARAIAVPLAGANGAVSLQLYLY